MPWSIERDFDPHNQVEIERWARDPRQSQFNKARRRGEVMPHTPPGSYWNTDCGFDSAKQLLPLFLKLPLLRNKCLEARLTSYVVIDVSRQSSGGVRRLTRARAPCMGVGNPHAIRDLAV